MTEDLLLQQLRELRYPADIDVVDSVMEQVRNKPLMVVPRRRKLFYRVATGVAAAAVLAVAINVTLLFTRDYNEQQISSMMAEVYDYSDDYSSSYAADYDFGAIESIYYE